MNTFLPHEVLAGEPADERVPEDLPLPQPGTDDVLALKDRLQRHDMKSLAGDRWQPVAYGLYCAAALRARRVNGGLRELHQECVGEETDPPPDKKPVATGTLVRASGDGFVLGDVEKSAISPQQFVDRLEKIRHAGRLGAAVRWVELYPDVAAAVLHEPAQVQASPELLEVVAQAHDQQCSRAAPTRTGPRCTATVRRTQSGTRHTIKNANNLWYLCKMVGPPKRCA